MYDNEIYKAWLADRDNMLKELEQLSGSELRRMLDRASEIRFEVPEEEHSVLWTNALQVLTDIEQIVSDILAERQAAFPALALRARGLAELSSEEIASLLARIKRERALVVSTDHERELGRWFNEPPEHDNTGKEVMLQILKERGVLLDPS